MNYEYIYVYIYISVDARCRVIIVVSVVAMVFAKVFPADAFHRACDFRSPSVSENAFDIPPIIVGLSILTLVDITLIFFFSFASSSFFGESVYMRARISRMRWSDPRKK